MTFAKRITSLFALRRSPRLLGMSPENGSSRRSPRLLGKSSITKPQRSRIKRRKPRKRDDRPRKRDGRVFDSGTTYIRNSDIEGFMRRCRKQDAQQFRSLYSMGSCDNIMEQRTYISSGVTSSCPDKSYGLTWVAVHGMDSICVVVFWKKPLDVARFSGFIKCGGTGTFFRDFVITVLSEIEDFADSSIESCQTFDQPIKKPFAVVPMIPCTTDVEGSGHEASTAVSNEKTAVKFLQEEMKSDIAFTRRETTQIAISALQHMVHQKFKANDIQVSLLVEGGDGVDYLHHCVVEKHLVEINEPGSSGSSGATTDESDIKYIITV